MVGIFLGSTPLNPSLGGTAFKEVYVGSTKVWPIGGGRPFPEIGFWASQHIHTNGNLLWASNPDITTEQNTTSNQRVTLGKTQSFNGVAPRLVGATYGNGAASNRMTAGQGGDRVLTPVNSFLTRGWADTSNVSPIHISSLMLVPPEQSDDLDYAVINVNSDGSIAWSSEPGFSTVQVQAGIFTINLPFEITRLVGMATARTGSSGSAVAANLASGALFPVSSIQGRTFSGTTPSYQAFSALIVKV